MSNKIWGWAILYHWWKRLEIYDKEQEKLLEEKIKKNQLDFRQLSIDAN